MRFEEVTRGLYLEGLCPDGDSVWVADPVRGGIRHVAGDGSTREYLPEKQWIGSLMLNSDGRLLVSGEGGITWLDGSTGETGVLLDTIDGKPIMAREDVRDTVMKKHPGDQVALEVLHQDGRRESVKLTLGRANPALLNSLNAQRAP